MSTDATAEAATGTTTNARPVISYEQCDGAGSHVASIDMDDIHKELRTAVSKEEEYKVVDDMKKRAIHSSETYDEFKNKVRCATMKTVSRREMEALHSVNPRNRQTLNSAVPSNWKHAVENDFTRRRYQYTTSETRPTANTAPETTQTNINQQVEEAKGRKKRIGRKR